MKLLGSRSLSSLLAVFVNALFVGACALGLLLLGLLPVALVGGTGNVTTGLPAAFTIDPSSYQLAVPQDPKVTAELQGAIYGTVLVRGGRKAMAVLTILVLLPTAAVAAVVLFRLRRIFRRLREGRPFLAENATDLRFIGVTVVIGEIVWSSLQF